MIAKFEQDYVNLINRILREGEFRQTRNAETVSIFGATLDIDMQGHYNEFPLLRGRRMFYKGVFGELDAMLAGASTIQEFEEHGCNYWAQWADEDGNLNIDYGNSWLDFNGVNQVEELIKGLKEDPNDRRHIITGWRPDRLKELSLPCCHMLYQWYVRDGEYLDMIWYQRSVDVMVGLPSDIILAYAWNILIATQTGYKPGKVKMVLGDTHIYSSHISNVHKYLQQVDVASRDITLKSANFLWKNHRDGINAKNIAIEDYHPQDAIKFEVHA